MAATEPVLVVWTVTEGGFVASLEIKILAMFSLHLSYETSLMVSGVPRIPPNPPTPDAPGPAPLPAPLPAVLIPPPELELYAFDTPNLVK